MSENRFKATARATVTVEFSLSDTWGDKCTVEQVIKQGRDSARGAMRNLLQNHPGIRMVGEPEIVAVLVTEPR